MQDVAQLLCKPTLNLVAGIPGFLVAGPLVRSLEAIASGWQSLLVLAIITCGGFLLARALAPLVAGCWHYKQAREEPKTSLVKVEGPYLRIQSGGPVVTNQLLHFRAIVDFTVIEDPQMQKRGIQALSLGTTSGEGDPFELPGIKNCLEVRNMLAEIDAAREDASPG